MAKKNTIQWVEANPNYWRLEVCGHTVAFIVRSTDDSFKFKVDFKLVDVAFSLPLTVDTVDEAKKEAYKLFEDAMFNVKKEMAIKIGNYFGDFSESADKYSIDNGEREFAYKTVDELLADWLDTVIENHHDAYYTADADKRNEADSWEKEIVFIYTMVLQELPKGIKASVSSDGFKWLATCDVTVDKKVGCGHSKTLCAGTYSSLAEAIFNQRKLDERVKSKKYTVDELSHYAKSLRCRVAWQCYGPTVHKLELCGNGVATIYVAKSPDTPDKFTYSSTIHSTYWHSNAPLKAETLEEAKVELENILLGEYEKYLEEVEKTVFIYKERIFSLKKILEVNPDTKNN